MYRWGQGREPTVTQPDWAPEGIDLSRPSVARVYDYYLGGYHNFPADRQLADQVIETYPLTRAAAKSIRAFLGRTVHHLAADLGVRQFLDLGSGIPTEGNVHDIVHAVDPQARVVYVDIDPVAVAHSEALLADVPSAAVVRADLRRPDQVLSAPAVGRLLDFSEPTALLLMSVLHFVPDEDDPAGIVGQYREALGGRSWAAISHGASEFHPETVQKVRTMYDRTSTPATGRTREEVLALLTGYEPLPPGMVLVEQWQPGRLAQVEDPERFAVWGAVARAS
jgi:hypothetical protein